MLSRPNAVSVLLAFAVATAGLLVSRSTLRWPRFSVVTYRVLLALALAPWYLHFEITRASCGGWGCGAGADVVPGAGLVVYSVASPLLAAALLFCALWLAPFAPGIAAWLPLAVALAELGATRLLYWRAPADYFHVDGKAGVPLVVLGAAATLFLVVFTSFQARPGRLPGVRRHAGRGAS